MYNQNIFVKYKMNEKYITGAMFCKIQIYVFYKSNNIKMNVNNM